MAQEMKVRDIAFGDIYLIQDLDHMGEFMHAEPPVEKTERIDSLVREDRKSPEKGVKDLQHA